MKLICEVLAGFYPPNGSRTTRSNSGFNMKLQDTLQTVLLLFHSIPVAIQALQSLSLVEQRIELLRRERVLTRVQGGDPSLPL